jgi:hypothetical protein
MIVIYIDYRVRDLIVKLFVYNDVILNYPLFGSLCGTIMTERLAHVLIDDHISWIIYMDISD